MAENSWQSPVSGEPSLGTPHPTKDASRNTGYVVNSSTGTAGVWSAAVTMPNVPAGAKAAWCMAEVFIAGGSPFLGVEAATGYTLSDISVGTNIMKYFFIYSFVQGVAMWFPLKIHLDSAGQFKWAVSITNATARIGYPIDYEM